jgi:hypothetical protein
MAQIENAAPLVRLRDTPRTLVHPAEDIRDREERVRRTVPYMCVPGTAGLTAAARIRGLP